MSCFIKIENGLPFWCRLTQIVLEKRSYRSSSTSTLLLSFNGLFFQDNLGKPAPEKQNHSGFTGARDSEWQWYQLGDMQICTSQKADNHPTTQFFTGRMPFLLLSQQRQSTEGKVVVLVIV